MWKSLLNYPSLRPGYWRLSQQLWVSSLLVTVLLLAITGPLIMGIEEEHHRQLYEENKNRVLHGEEVKVHTRELFYVLTLVLLSLAASMILLTRLIVVGPIRLIHEALQTDVPPLYRMPFASRELCELAEVITVLLQLKKNTKRSELRYRGLFDHMASSCMVLTEIKGEGDYYIEDVNGSCHRLPVLAMASRKVSRFSEVLEKNQAKLLYDALHHSAAQQVHCHVGEFLLTRAGLNYWLDCHVFALDGGELVLMLRDVTEGKISQDLKGAKEAAEQANELKSSFLASMSHEIRTPLNGVLSMIELLRGTRLSNKQRHWIEAIRGSGQLLLSTINDILDFSRIEAGRLQLEEIHFSLGEVIGNVFNATSQRAFSKGLELVLHQDPALPEQLIGDPFRIQQILINLVGNAIKFTETGTVEITLSMQGIPGNRLMLCVTVCDTGIGIAPEQVEQIFLPFEQGSANRFLFCEGTGLGLAISKHLVDAMGGSMGVESRLGSGSEFHFEVPVGMDKIPTEHWLIPEGWYQSPAFVWVGHEAVRLSIIRVLNTFGFQTHAATSMAETGDWHCQLNDKDGACLVVLDDSLMGQEGFQLLSDLKERSGNTPQFVLYVVNMFNRDKGELDCLDDLPNTAYVMKPVHASALFNALQQLFGLSNEIPTFASKLENLSWEALIERSGAREHLSGARLLLVEDNPVNREVAEEALSMVGIDVEVAVNGQEAVALACVGNTFDGVLMDLQMPLMDGFQATEIIRRRFDSHALPIIAMTAGVMFKDRQRSLEVGMNDHVSKPINLHNLLITLIKWVKPAQPRPFKSNRTDKSSWSLLEEVLAGNGGVDWAKVELPGIKIFKGLNRLGGDRKLYFKLVKSFVKTHGESEADLLTALADENVQTVRRLAHTLKGVAATIGAESLHESAVIVERESLNSPMATLRAVSEPLLLHLNEVLNSLNTLLKSTRNSERAEPQSHATSAVESTVDSARLYVEIIDLLENSDTRLQEICTANHALIFTWFAGSESYEEFMESIEQYRFEAAREQFLSQTKINMPIATEGIPV